MATVDILRFTRDWTDPAQFPSVEPNENTARFDMQDLHNQTRDYINNTIIPALPTGVVDTDENMRGYRITELGAPVNDNDAVNKKYVDSLSKSVRVAAFIGTTWSGTTAPYAQTLAIADVNPDSIVEVSLSAAATVAQAAAFSALQLQDGGQASGTITLRCFGAKNTVSIPVNIVIRRD